MGQRSRLVGVLLANGLLRVASASGGALVGFYLAALARRGLPVDPTLVGTIGVVSNVAELAVAVPMGMLADRYSPRRMLVWSTLVGALATQLFSIGGVVAIFLLSRSLESMAAVAGGPALLAHLSDVTRHNHALRGRVMGYYEISLLAGLALGTLVGGTLWEAVQTTAFSLLAIIYVVVAGLFWWSTAGTPSIATQTSPLAGLGAALRDPLLLRLAPAWLAVNAIIGMWLTHIGFLLSGPAAPGQTLVGQFTPREVGFILLGYALALTLGVVGWTLVLPRLTRIRALRISLTALLGVCVGVALLNAPIIWPIAAQIAWILLIAVAVTVGSGFTPAALAYLADLTGDRSGRGAALGIYTGLFSLGNALGAGVGGALGLALALNGIVLGTFVLLLIALVAIVLLPQGG